ncbi:MAG: ATP synthase F1 subunit epsilon [Lachnospiraceae bacterium]|nr:ATP synthase F1 subunit epsilon [Lachnospiraceae bacterium]
MDNTNLFDLEIIMPERVFYQGKVSMVEFNTTEGEIGIYKRHIPTTVIIEPGILTITEPDGIKNAALHSGFAEILPDKVTILAELVEWPDEIDLDRAERAKERAEERLARKNNSNIDVDRANIALKKAICRLSAK